MDWYVLGRILGVIGWPLAAAAAVYGVGWLIAALRPRAASGALRVWVNIVAALVFLVTLFATGLHLLRYFQSVVR